MNCRDPQKDARGVVDAIDFVNSNYNQLAALAVKNICIAVINRYDQTEKGAQMTTMATDILSQVNNGSWIIRVSDIKKLSLYLMPKVK